MTHGLDTSFLVATAVSGHPDHLAARALASALRHQGDRFAIAPQALAEFAHIVTYPKRFTSLYSAQQRAACSRTRLTLLSPLALTVSRTNSSPESRQTMPPVRPGPDRG